MEACFEFHRCLQFFFIEVVLRYSYIDALRGIAALYVVFGHALNWYFLNISQDVDLSFEWVKQFTSALSGVFLFFAISGYVIPSSFHEHHFEGVRRFAIRRFFRLYPLFWVSLIPSIVHCFRAAAPTYSLETVLYNFTMVPGFFGYGFVVGVYWSLAHELIFYFLCALLHLCGWLHESGKIAAIVLSLNGGYWLLRLGEWFGIWKGAPTFFQKTVLLTLAIMFWGALWRFYQDKRDFRFLQKMALLSVPAQWMILVACRPFFTQAEAKANFPISFAISIAAAIGLFMLGTTWLKLKHSFLIWSGMASYSFYLFHMFVILYAARGFAHFYSGVPSLFTFAATVMLGSFIAAAAGYYFIERPSIALGKQLARRPEAV